MGGESASLSSVVHRSENVSGVRCVFFPMLLPKHVGVGCKKSGTWQLLVLSGAGTYESHRCVEQ